MQKQIQVVVAHTFNLSTKGEYEMGGDQGSGLSLQSPSLGRGKTFLVAWLFCFSDLHPEAQYLSLGFYYPCYRLANEPIQVQGGGGASHRDSQSTKARAWGHNQMKT